MTSTELMQAQERIAEEVRREITDLVENEGLKIDDLNKDLLPGVPLYKGKPVLTGRNDLIFVELERRLGERGVEHYLVVRWDRGNDGKCDLHIQWPSGAVKMGRSVEINDFGDWRYV